MPAGTRPAANTTPEMLPNGAWQAAHRPAVSPPRQPSHRSSGRPRVPPDHTPDRSVLSSPVARPPIPKLPHHPPAACRWCALNSNPRPAVDRQCPKRPAARKDAAGRDPTRTGMRCGIAGHLLLAQKYSFLSSSHINTLPSSKTCINKGDGAHSRLDYVVRFAKVGLEAAVDHSRREVYSTSFVSQ